MSEPETTRHQIYDLCYFFYRSTSTAYANAVAEESDDKADKKEEEELTDKTDVTGRA